MNIRITKHANDVIQKYANSLFRNASLDFYGIKTAPIKELINPELPTLEVSGGAADIVFLLTDDSYLHFAFETGHNSTGAMIKSAGYDLRLYERDRRLIHSVIIYTADVKIKPNGLHIGKLAYTPDIILMGAYDGNSIFSDLESKLEAKHDLSDLDMLNLVLLPLMRHTIPRKELAVKSIELAQAIPDMSKRNACIAAVFAFASKYLEENDIDNLMEVLKMTDLGTMLVMSAVKDALNERDIAIAKEMIINDEPMLKILKYSKLDEPVVKRLQAELQKA